MKYYRIEGDGLQWPVPDCDHPGTCTLHKDGCFTCGQGRFMAIDWTPPAEVPDEEYPMVLSTGRRLYQYHSRTQTGRCLGFNDILGEETADISPPDAVRLGIDHGETVKVTSRRGEGEGQGQGHPRSARRPGLDGLPLPGGLRQLAHQPGLRPGFPDRGI